MSTAAEQFTGAYPFFHRGPTSLPFLEPIAVDTDPTISPGWARPIGWRVATADGLAAWDKTGPADTDWTPLGPLTPTTGSGHALDITLSFGMDQPINQAMPVGPFSFWLAPHTTTDTIVDSDQIEWAINENDTDLQWLSIQVTLYEAASLPEEGMNLIVTQSGVDTALFVTLTNTESRLYLGSSLNLDAEGSIGVRVDGSGISAESDVTARFTVRVVGDLAAHP